MTVDMSIVFGQCTSNLNIYLATTSRQHDFSQHVSFIGTKGPNISNDPWFHLQHTAVL